MKCRSKIDENSVNEYEQSLLMDGGIQCEDPLASGNKDEMIKEFLRKNFLKFYINIYKDQQPATHSSSRSSMMSSGNPAGVTPAQGSGAMSNNGNIDDSDSSSRYMLDIHLFKGTVYVFMDFVRKFMHVLTASCSMCSNNSCCSSSNHSSVMGDGQSNNRFIVPTTGHHHDYNLKIFI
jgi:hypothetical protein